MEIFICRKGTSKNVTTTLKEELYFERKNGSFSLHFYKRLDGYNIYNTISQADYILKLVIEENNLPKAIMTLDKNEKVDCDLILNNNDKNETILIAKCNGNNINDVSLKINPSRIYIMNGFIANKQCEKLIEYAKNKGINIERL